YTVLDRCFAQLRKVKPPFNPEHYGTQPHAQDVRALMELLPYEQWNLLGVSYGTRVAIEAANVRAESKNNPVRSVILDSVYPPNRGGVTSFPAVLDRAFANFFQWCKATESCATDLPIELALDAALSQLREAPVTLTVARRNGDIPVELVVNDHRFMSAVFSALYSKHQWSSIPAAINAVLDNDNRALLSLMEPFVASALDEGFYSLAFMAVDCRDHGISSREAYQQELEKYPRWREYTSDLWQYQACHFLSEGSAAIASTSVFPDVPALILAGELDPITPVEWAQSLHREWPGSQLHVVPNTGHAVINSDDCVYQSLRSFLDEPTKPVVFCGE
ncbi:MAG TPA: alpha/beta fold hydrolase, partial [Cellvibrio sp.]|nr:alpha/beta fold hydrolase [Cellvibrio sp.]